MKIYLLIVIVALNGCATHEVTFWEKVKDQKGKQVVVVHHVRHTSKGVEDRSEKLTSNTMLPADVHVYDVGRMPTLDGKGMNEAHRYYRVVESETFDLRLPQKANNASSGPKTVFTPPNYSPPSKDQKINDAIAEAKEAARKLDETREKIEQKLAQDNALQGQVQGLQDENADLRNQLNAGLSAKPSPSPTPQSQSADTLATWGGQLKQ